MAHLLLRAVGARIPSRVCLGCCRFHREFYSLRAVGKLQGVDGIVRLALILTGQTVITRCVFQFSFQFSSTLTLTLQRGHLKLVNVLYLQVGYLSWTQRGTAGHAGIGWYVLLCIHIDAIDLIICIGQGYPDRALKMYTL